MKLKWKALFKAKATTIYDDGDGTWGNQGGTFNILYRNDALEVAKAAYREGMKHGKRKKKKK